MRSPPSLRVLQNSLRSPSGRSHAALVRGVGGGRRGREGAFLPAEMTPHTPTVCLPQRCHPVHLLSPPRRPVSGRHLCAVQTEGVSDLSGPDLKKLERLPVGDSAGSCQVPTRV